MSKKDVEKTTTTSGTRLSQDDNKQEEGRTGQTHSSSLSEQQHSFNRVLDETKENIKRSIEGARREIPKNTQAISDYQEQTLQTAKEITDNYLDSQKEIINSFQSAWAPHIENYYNIWNSWTSPQKVAERYARAISNFAENNIAASRIGNNAIIANMDTFRTFLQREKEDAKEFSRIGVNTARTYAQTSNIK